MYIQNKPLYWQEIEAERQGIVTELFAAGEGVRRGGQAAAGCRCNSIWIISPGMENWLILAEGSQGWVRQLGEETGREGRREGRKEGGRLLSVRAGGKQKERVVMQDQKIFLAISYYERCAGCYSSSFFTQLCSGNSLYLCSDWAYSWEGNAKIWLSHIDSRTACPVGRAQLLQRRLTWGWRCLCSAAPKGPYEGGIRKMLSPW